MKIKNSQLVSILKTEQGDAWEELINKKLPVKVLYSVHRSIPKLHEAYVAYEQTLAKICKSYGVTLDNLKVDDPVKQVMLQEEIMTLLNEEVEIETYPFDESILMQCGEGVYEAITINEYERLSWLFE